MTSTMKHLVMLMPALALLAAWPVTLLRAAERPNFLIITWEDTSPHFGWYGCFVPSAEFALQTMETSL